MFDFLHNLTKSAEEKRQEAITAYLDDAMSPSERERFAAQLAQDPELQAAVARERAVKQSLSQLPQRRVPRNFTLDPARYGRPAKQPLVQAYPVLRAATGLAAFFFIFALAAGLYLGGTAQDSPMAAESGAASVAMDTAVEQEAEPAAATDTESVELAVEESAPAEEIMEEEEAMEEEAASDEEMFFDATVEFSEEEQVAEEPAPAAPVVEGDSMNGEEAPTGGEDASSTPLPTPTIAGTATPTAVPTATTSQLPRATATAELTDRAVSTMTTTADAGELALAATEAVNDSDMVTAVPPQTEQPPSQPVNTLFIIQIGLLLLLIILGAVTLYARRQL